jgi:hypothetical protein
MVKIHWYRHAMRQIENFDFDPQNKIRICCLARSLHARSLRQQLGSAALLARFRLARCGSKASNHTAHSRFY